MKQPKPKLTAEGEVVRKLLPRLRERALASEKGTVRSWTVEELSLRIGKSKPTVRSAIKQLATKTDAKVFFKRDMVKLEGPRRIDYRSAFAVGAVPCTKLAKSFRTHGVYLEKNLTPLTSWAQRTETCLTGGISELVLTLAKKYITSKKGVHRYDSTPDKSTKWENTPRNKARLREILRAQRVNDGRIRVIRVDGEYDDQEVFHISDSEFDGNYWRVESVDPRTGRFTATRTSEKAKSFALSKTSGVTK